jgi:predicted N-formylglutamate amidohydrolase
MRSALETASTSPDSSLIGAGDPAPFTLLNVNGKGSVLLVCDHASRAFPARLERLGLSAADTERHIAWDIGAASLTRVLGRLFDAPAVLAGYSRLLIDCNRDPADVTSIVAASDGVAVPGNQKLGDAERAARLHTFFEAYHRAIELRLDEFRRREIVPAFISMHSFTPVMGSEPRPWNIGVLWDQDPRIAVPMLERLRAIEGLNVGDNLPYSGRHPADYTVARHAERAKLPHVCIEVRQDQIDTAAGVRQWAELLHGVLEPILLDPGLHHRLKE